MLYMVEGMSEESIHFGLKFLILWIFDLADAEAAMCKNKITQKFHNFFEVYLTL